MEKYVKDIEEKFQCHGVYKKLKVLEAAATFPVSGKVRDALETIDKLMTELMTSAEDGFQRLFTGP